MEEEICINCKQDNGVNTRTYCKFCGEALCKNIWELNHNKDTYIIVSTKIIKNEFEDFSLPPEYNTINHDTNKYKFVCYKTIIFFENDVIKFYVKDLDKPLCINFYDVFILKIEQNIYFKNYSFLTIILHNKTAIQIDRNNINLKLFDILNKFLDMKTVSKPDIIVKT
tara:strand:+ start:1815 stop:2318 length:504 start_codon:yes stop_codon:yes gene_type:complete